MELSGYLTNLGKYNEGELVGTWVKFPCTDEDIENAMKEIGAGEVPYEETFWTDWDCDIEGLGTLLGKYPNIDEVNEIAETIEEIGDDEKVEAIIEAYGVDGLEQADDLEYIPYSDLNSYNREEGLGYYIVENSYGDEFNIPRDTLERYFDYESFGRDIRLGGDAEDEDIESAIDKYPAYSEDEAIGLYFVEDIDGGVEELDTDTLARYFNYEMFGRDCTYDYNTCENGYLSSY